MFDSLGLIIHHICSMKEIDFYKYQGTGNDFVLINQTEVMYDLSENEICFICNRRFGVGADGLMILRKHPNYDFEMLYYNSDGRPGSMCGNGGRCIVKLAYDEGLIDNKTKFIAADGEHDAVITGDIVGLKMSDVEHVSVIEQGISYELNTGSPHYVSFFKSEEELDQVVNFGKSIRYNDIYKSNGINVNLVYQKADNEIVVATYERGVEDETYSCGTGVTACALVMGLLHNHINHVDIKTKGGKLSVTFKKAGKTFTDIILSGPAIKVFEGRIML